METTADHPSSSYFLLESDKQTSCRHIRPLMKNVLRTPFLLDSPLPQIAPLAVHSSSSFLADAGRRYGLGRSTLRPSISRVIAMSNTAASFLPSRIKAKVTKLVWATAEAGFLHKQWRELRTITSGSSGRELWKNLRFFANVVANAKWHTSIAAPQGKAVNFAGPCAGVVVCQFQLHMWNMVCSTVLLQMFHSLNTAPVDFRFSPFLWRLALETRPPIHNTCACYGSAFHTFKNAALATFSVHN